MLFIAIRVLISVAVLLYASFKDVKTRTVENTVWKYYFPVALSFTVLDLALNPLLLNAAVLSLCVCVPFFFMLYFAGGFGGADVKALLCLAVALPIYPFSSISLTANFFPLAVLLVACVSALCFSVYTKIKKKWTTKGLPMMVFILVGFLVALYL